MVRSPPFSRAALPHLEPTCSQGVPAFYSHTGPRTSGCFTTWASCRLGCLPMACSQPCLQVVHRVITRLPQTHLSFCSQGKELGLGSGGRDDQMAPKWTEHQQPNCRTTFVFLKFLFALISFRCTRASFRGLVGAWQACISLEKSEYHLHTVKWTDLMYIGPCVLTNDKCLPVYNPHHS